MYLKCVTVKYLKIALKTQEPQTMKNNIHSNYFVKTSPFFKPLKQIPAFVIVCNAAGPLTEEYPNDA